VIVFDTINELTVNVLNILGPDVVKLPVFTIDPVSIRDDVVIIPVSIDENTPYKLLID
jgi:hypothetical protein